MIATIVGNSQNKNGNLETEERLEKPTHELPKECGYLV